MKYRSLLRSLVREVKADKVGDVWDKDCLWFGRVREDDLHRYARKSRKTRSGEGAKPLRPAIGHNTVAAVYAVDTNTYSCEPQVEEERGVRSRFEKTSAYEPWSVRKIDELVDHTLQR